MVCLHPAGPTSNGRSARASIFDTQYIKNGEAFGRKETQRFRFG
jgi:hypothetical protein